MNIRDCINIIKNCTTLACEYHIKGKCDYSYEERERRYEYAKEQAIKALEKQIPKKPIELDKWGEYYECPICNKYAVDNLGCKYKFCRECGQKFDW